MIRLFYSLAILISASLVSPAFTVKRTIDAALLFLPINHSQAVPSDFDAAETSDAIKKSTACSKTKD